MAATTYFNKFSSYCKMVSHAKNLAKRSLLVDHCGLEHIDLTSNFTNVDRVYSIEKETRKGYSKLSLIEFKTIEDADKVMRSAHHIEGLLPIPLKILRYNGRGSQDPRQQSLPFPVEHVRLSCERELSPDFKNYTDLISNNMMSLVALKLRFVTLVNFEKILCSGMFDEYELMPFGSSVIDMGCDSGDLDLIITRKIDHHQAIMNALSNREFKSPEGRSRYTSQSTLQSDQLVHLGKSIYSETKDNSGFRGAMRWFDHILREYMPLTDGFGVLSLHRAKVPIIKFTSRITNIDCDLSFDLGLDHRDFESNSPVHAGIMMTEILYALCRNNNLITALVIYLRIYSKINSITSKVPGVGLTNFQFLSLIIFFLQQTSFRKAESLSSRTPIDHQGRTNHHRQIDVSHTGEPEMRHKYSYIQRDKPNLDPNGRRSREYLNHRDTQTKPLVPPFKEMVNGEFLRNESTMTVQLYEEDELNQALPNLIMRFFYFYSTFDFDNHALNLFESRRDKKLDNSTMYVMNPLETNRNICHNVNRRALEHLVKQMRSSYSKNQSSTFAPLSENDPNRQASTNDPLSQLKAQMIKHKKQVKKSRTLGFNDQEEIANQEVIGTTNHYITSDGIAQDVCR